MDANSRRRPLNFFPAPPYPASTLLIVAGLADPGMLVEIEVVAAK